MLGYLSRCDRVESGRHQLFGLMDIDQPAPPQPSDEELVERSRKTGDMQCFEEIWRRYSGKVYGKRGRGFFMSTCAARHRKNYLPSTMSIPMKSSATFARGSLPTRSVRRSLSRVNT